MHRRNQENLLQIDFLTKGDDNMVNDRGLIEPEKWLKNSDIVGKVEYYIPLVGNVRNNNKKKINFILADFHII